MVQLAALSLNLNLVTSVRPHILCPEAMQIPTLWDYSPVTNALVVVKCGSRYLLGFNKWRKRFEIFGGCREENETLRECISRETMEELGLKNVNFEYFGLVHYNMAPSYFNKEWHEEYGALYGLIVPESSFVEIESSRIDRDEIERLAFYDEIKGKEYVAQIDEYLLTCVKNKG